VPAVERALNEAGMDVRRVREGRGFFRLEVREYEEVTEVDLGADARLLPIERGEFGPILAGEELAVDKVLAVFGRAEARDFVDLSAVADRYGLVYLCQRALDKDRGFDPQVGLEPTPPAPEAHPVRPGRLVASATVPLNWGPNPPRHGPSIPVVLI
jgi:hypothetical protein